MTNLAVPNNNRGYWWQGVGAYAVLMAIAAVIPLPEQPETPVGPLDKLAHLCEYALFAWGLVQAATASRWSTARTWRFALLIPLLYGGLLEGIQAFLPYRSAEWQDLLANAGGVGAGFLAGQRWPVAAGPHAPS